LGDAVDGGDYRISFKKKIIESKFILKFKVQHGK
jgi:hypothetical protein